ncbi:MAG: hypothetical protein ACTSRZ_14100 [Promethearchaeota archaeon]
MAKKQKKKIKTSRYWTRKCDNCGFEYPNWFVQCPKCKKTWDESKSLKETTEINESTLMESTNKTQEISEEELKTVRIIAQIAEEDVKIKSMTIYFSGDNGISWFQMPMVKKNDYFVAEILNVPLDSIIIYYLRGVDENGEEFIEDNDGEFYYYNVRENLALIKAAEEKKEALSPSQPQQTKEIVAEESAETEETGTTDYKEKEMPSKGPFIFSEYIPPKKQQLEKKGIQTKSSSEPQPIMLKEIEIDNDLDTKSTSIAAPETDEPIEITPPPFSSEETTSRAQFYNPNSDDVIFTPLDKIKKDQNLKTCPNCSARIKKDWAVCPICGFRF